MSGQQTGQLLQRRIGVTFTKANGNFTGSNKNTFSVDKLRARADISKAGGLSWGMLNLAVFGLTLSQMNDLSTLGQIVSTDVHNLVQVYAGDDVNGMSLVYDGTIFQCWADFTNPPNVCMRLQAQTGLSDAIAPAPANSYPGSADAAVIVSDMAKQLGYNFVNEGVSGIFLQDSYFPGTALVQLQECVDAAGINMSLENNTVAIWPRGGTRKTPVVPTIGQDIRMVGYPTYTANGLNVTCEYSPTLVFGGTAKVKSILKGTEGVWQIYGLTHTLESETPNGQWFTEVKLLPPGLYTQAF